MKNQYCEEFNQAYQRSLMFKLQVQNIPPKGEKLLTESRLQVIYGEAYRLHIGEVNKQCLNIHFVFKARLEKLWGIPIIYTIGYVSTPNSGDMFKKSEEELFKLMQEKIMPSEFKLHAWLTLPSMEVIDLSFPTSYAIHNGVKPKQNQVSSIVASYPHEVEDLVCYHPMVLGEDYLYKIGALPV